jgi:hypothetical protein
MIIILKSPWHVDRDQFCQLRSSNLFLRSQSLRRTEGTLTIGALRRWPRHLAVDDGGDRIDQKRVVGDLVEAVEYCWVGEYPATCILHAVAVELDFVSPSIAARDFADRSRKGVGDETGILGLDANYCLGGLNSPDSQPADVRIESISTACFLRHAKLA